MNGQTDTRNDDIDHCDCSNGRLLGTAPACDEVHPDGRFVCTKPPDHDGPHSACSPYGHPEEVWE